MDKMKTPENWTDKTASGILIYFMILPVLMLLSAMLTFIIGYILTIYSPCGGAAYPVQLAFFFLSMTVFTVVSIKTCKNIYKRSNAKNDNDSTNSITVDTEK